MIITRQKELRWKNKILESVCVCVCDSDSASEMLRMMLICVVTCR